MTAQPVDDPLTDVTTLPDLLARRAAISADATAFIAADGTVIRYAILERRARQVATGLRTAGVKHGDRIAYLGRNSVDYYEILFGAARLGAVFMPLNWRLADTELVWLIEDAGVRVIFGEPGNWRVPNCRVSASIARSRSIARGPNAPIMPVGATPTGRTSIRMARGRAMSRCSSTRRGPRGGRKARCSPIAT